MGRVRKNTRILFFALFVLWVGINLMFTVCLYLDEFLYYSLLDYMMKSIPHLFIGSDHKWEYANDINMFFSGVAQLGLVPLWLFSLRVYPKDLIEDAKSTPGGMHELKSRSGRMGYSLLFLASSMALLFMWVLFDSWFGDGPMVLVLVGHSYILSPFCLAVCCCLDLTGKLKSIRFMALLSVLAPLTFLLFWGGIGFLFQVVISIVSVVMLIQRVENFHLSR